MTRKEWTAELTQDFTGDLDADVRMLKNAMVDGQYRADAGELRAAALLLIAKIVSPG